VFQNGQTANDVGATLTAETVNLTPPPDLAVSSVTAPSTASASHGLTFSYHVTNAGATATPNTVWLDSYYLSPTATFNSSTAILIGQLSRLGSLKAGDGYSNTVTGTVPNGLSGTYYLIVDTDSAGAVFELDKSNNFGAAAGTVQVSSHPADLAVTSASAPSTGPSGAAVLLNWTVTNQGAGDTVATNWMDNVYVDAGGTLDKNAVLLDRSAMPVCLIRAIRTSSRNWSPCRSICPGSTTCSSSPTSRPIRKSRRRFMKPIPPTTRPPPCRLPSTSNWPTSR